MNPDLKNKTLIAIVGPTASGKTAIAIELAQALNTAILSADSRQFYREMAIGTAKPTPAELGQAQHYFVNSHSVTESFTVGDFEQEGLKLLDQIFATHHTAIIAGGSGLYVRAICEGFDNLPTASAQVRTQLNNQLSVEGIESLQKRLKEVDPDYYNQVDHNNPQRIIRALEVYEATGSPFSSFRKGATKARPFNILKVGIAMPRDILYERINMRVDAMIQQGLVAEVTSLLPYRYLNALNTVGYSEIFEYLDGKTSLQAAIDQIKQHTRRFAKRQMTWFNKDKEINWLPASNIKAFILNALGNKTE